MLFLTVYCTVGHVGLWKPSDANRRKKEGFQDGDKNAKSKLWGKKVNNYYFENDYIKSYE